MSQGTTVKLEHFTQISACQYKYMQHIGILVFARVTLYISNFYMLMQNQFLLRKNHIL